MSSTTIAFELLPDKEVLSVEVEGWNITSTGMLVYSFKSKGRLKIVHHPKGTWRALVVTEHNDHEYPYVQ